MKKLLSIFLTFVLFLSGCTNIKHTSNNGELEVYFIDVGQGDASLIICENETMLIDGGTSDNSRKIYSFLKEHDIDHLKYIVATHPHEDHVGGLSAALEYAECDEILTAVEESDNYYYQQFISKASEKNVDITVGKDGDSYTLGSATITMLGPTDELPDDVNNNSLVFRMDYKDTSFLFTGDAEQLEEQLLLYNHYDELNVDVVKVAHHGSYNSASSAWFKAVKPKYAVVSCGSGNSYGHPHEMTLNYLKEYVDDLYRTDLQGTIHCSTDGYHISFSTEKETSIDVFTPGEDITSTSSPIVVDENTTFILNTNSKIFHKVDCDSVSKMSEKNREAVTLTREELIQQGYTPCGYCNP